MAALSHFALWLDLATSPLVALATLALTLASGRRGIVRLGAMLCAAGLGALTALGGTPSALALAAGIGALAGLAVAEIWLGLVLPVAIGLVRLGRRCIAYVREQKLVSITSSEAVLRAPPGSSGMASLGTQPAGIAMEAVPLQDVRILTEFRSAPHVSPAMIAPVAEHAQRSRTTILLVEDEPLVRLDLAETFRDAGFAVVECATAEEGAGMLGSGQPIHAIVTDVRTPGAIDGLALATLARERDAAMPVIVISGHLEPQEAALADVFVRKPVSSEAVRAALERLVGNSGSTD
ncbi:response regulator [Salinarimonas ramus]|uniref:Response regulatory domain-containing protein n=1 Tax=Salinarimonas ramus TaxID=690164 RepID=A0A917V552_9HYPH|nr:response regulator [Salinarimonas ramus]GGK41246.1 hypothetical protein GCM10011322_30460 [Salinarimonas ramus]